jgi:hypothetical protein
MPEDRVVLVGRVGQHPPLEKDERCTLGMFFMPS